MAVFRTHKAGYMAVAIFWFIGLSLLVVYSLTSQSTPVVQPSFKEIVYPDNSITDVRLFHQDPNNKNGAFSFSFDSLSTKNGNFGIFKTALQRTLCIQGLRLGIYDKGLSDSNEMGLNDSSLALDRTLGYVSSQLAAYLQNSSQGQDDYTVDLGVDFRNISKLFVKDFQFDHYLDGAPDLSIKSKMARTDPGQPGLLLRGHVVISASSRAVLQCNQVLWDVKNQTFTAKGRYTLTRNGVNTTGSNICLDMNLNTIPNLTKHRKDGKESFPWYAQAQ